MCEGCGYRDGQVYSSVKCAEVCRPEHDISCHPVSLSIYFFFLFETMFLSESGTHCFSRLSPREPI